MFKNLIAITVVLSSYVAFAAPPEVTTTGTPAEYLATHPGDQSGATAQAEMQALENAKALCGGQAVRKSEYTYGGHSVCGIVYGISATATFSCQAEITAKGSADEYMITTAEARAAIQKTAEATALANAKVQCGGEVIQKSEFSYAYRYGCGQFYGVDATAQFACQ